MKGLFKKTVAGVMSVALLASMSAAALAHSEMDNMVFAGYDTTDPENPNRVYNEVINGRYTNKQVLIPVTPEWRIEGYETAYPHAGYSRMYLDGKAQDITHFNNLFPQWETRNKDYMWEISYNENGEHMIWQRQQTKINNKTWAWDFGNDALGIPDSVVMQRTNRAAYVVKKEFKDYGFGRYTMDGKVLSDEEVSMYADWGLSDVITNWTAFVEAAKAKDSDGDGVLSYDEKVTSLLSQRDDHGRYVITDADISAMIGVVENQYITAKFSKNSNDGLATRNIAEEYLKHRNDGWNWNYGTLRVKAEGPAISWTDPAVTFENTDPYLQYQYLVVNGVAMDGHYIGLDKNGNKLYADKIIRYTGGKATPNITWKFAFFRKAIDKDGTEIPNVYEVVEQKFVNGQPGYDGFVTDKKGNVVGNPIYRIPTGRYGNTYFKLNGNKIELWVTDEYGNKGILETFENKTGNLGGLIDAYTTGMIHVDGYYDWR